MKRTVSHQVLEALPTAVVLLVVSLAGSRLIYLSVQHHAAAARTAAATVAASFARKIEPGLQSLADLAERQAASAAPPAPGTFWMTAEDRVLESGSPDAATAAAVAGEWQSAETIRAAPPSAVLGPIRFGSRWLLAVRSPGPSSTSAVAFEDLDELIADTHLARLGEMGYEFELSQVETRSARSRSFVGSNTELLADAVTAKIRTPAAAAIPGSYLQVAVRPRDGWYPTTLLASEIGLLAFLAWLLAFGTHDLSHALQRSRAALAASRRRLHSVNQRLAAEMQQRLTLQETFDHARFHDAFTGLPNRRFFMDQLDRALRDLRTERRRRIAVIIVDIARFKLVNDMLGHTAGDELMVQAARRFEKSTSGLEAVLARWSGDQIAVLLLDAASVEAPLEVARLLREQLRTPVELRRHRLIVAANVGVTNVDSGQQRAEDVVREADIALSVAKRQESAGIVVYAPNMAGQAANLVSLEADLHLALEKQELRLVFQPIVDLVTYKMVGAEVLLRWQHPVEGLLAPDRFLSIAEEAGLMGPITRWIILRVAKLAADWLRRIPARLKFFISINLSPMAVRDPGLSEFVATVLRDHRLPSWVLKFELTEAALISDAAAARDTLERLRAAGVQLMLDDFGTGYSSLSYLQLFPFDFVKIDRPFVNRTDSDRANTGMMAAMVQMARSLNLTAIAEIIETEAAATALKEMGCDYGQGYYFSEPVDSELALQRLRTQEAFQPSQSTAATVDTADTMMVRPLPQPAPSRNVHSREADIADDSPTIMIPSDSIQFPPDGDQ